MAELHYGVAVIDEANGSMAPAITAQLQNWAPVLCYNTQGIDLLHVFFRDSPNDTHWSRSGLMQDGGVNGHNHAA